MRRFQGVSAEFYRVHMKINYLYLIRLKVLNKHQMTFSLSLGVQVITLRVKRYQRFINLISSSCFYFRTIDIISRMTYQQKTVVKRRILKL